MANSPPKISLECAGISSKLLIGFLRSKDAMAITLYPFSVKLANTFVASSISDLFKWLRCKMCSGAPFT